MRLIPCCINKSIIFTTVNKTKLEGLTLLFFLFYSLFIFYAFKTETETN